MHKLVVGTHKGLLIFEEHKGEWALCQESFPAIPVSYAALDPRHGTLWACLDHGHWGCKLHRSDDEGKTWREIPAPAYPEGEMVGDDPAKLSYIWLMEPGGADQPNRLYLGTEPGGLFQSDDGGESFHLVRGLWDVPERREWWFGGGRDKPGLCSIEVDPRNSQHITIGISVGGVYESLDGGQTWAARNTGLKAEYLPNPDSEFGHDPHFMTASPGNPDVLWQQNHCGVFRSEDGGKHWDNLSAGVVKFGFAVAVQDAQTAWVVPAHSDEQRIPINRSLCVCRTEDGGKTWQELREGLPQVGCYDLVYRHALDLQGKSLAFGTTTGNLFFSSNRGDSWQCLDYHLPPIYSVRFMP